MLNKRTFFSFIPGHYCVLSLLFDTYRIWRRWPFRPPLIRGKLILFYWAFTNSFPISNIFWKDWEEKGHRIFYYTFPFILGWCTGVHMNSLLFKSTLRNISVLKKDVYNFPSKYMNRTSVWEQAVQMCVVCSVYFTIKHLKLTLPRKGLE